jgi:hypothetical protein
MNVYHGTTPDCGRQFTQFGIDAHQLHPRLIKGPQDAFPGIFVTPYMHVARRFGLCIVKISVRPSDLNVPPNLELAGATVCLSLTNPAEPQAFLVMRVEPEAVCIVECYEYGYPFNPYEDQAFEINESS